MTRLQSRMRPIMAALAAAGGLAAAAGARADVGSSSVGLSAAASRHTLQHATGRHACLRSQLTRLTKPRLQLEPSTEGSTVATVAETYRNDSRLCELTFVGTARVTSADGKSVVTKIPSVRTFAFRHGERVAVVMRLEYSKAKVERKACPSVATEVVSVAVNMHGVMVFPVDPAFVAVCRSRGIVLRTYSAS